MLVSHLALTDLFGRLTCKRVHHARREDERGADIHRNRHAQRLGDLRVARALLPGRVDVRRDAAVALARDADGDGDDPAALRLAMGGRVAGRGQLAVSAHGPRREPARDRHTPRYLLPAVLPVEHHRTLLSAQRARSARAAKHRHGQTHRVYSLSCGASGIHLADVRRARVPLRPADSRPGIDHAGQRSEPCSTTHHALVALRSPPRATNLLSRQPLVTAQESGENSWARSPQETARRSTTRTGERARSSRSRTDGHSTPTRGTA